MSIDHSTAKNLSKHGITTVEELANTLPSHHNTVTYANTKQSLIEHNPLQVWIKKVIRHCIQEKDYYLLKHIKNTPFNRQVIITNGRMPEERSNTMCLSTPFEDREIKQDSKGFEWYRLKKIF